MRIEKINVNYVKQDLIMLLKKMIDDIDKKDNNSLFDSIVNNSDDFVHCLYESLSHSMFVTVSYKSDALNFIKENPNVNPESLRV